MNDIKTAIPFSQRMGLAPVGYMTMTSSPWGEVSRYWVIQWPKALRGLEVGIFLLDSIFCKLPRISPTRYWNLSTTPRLVTGVQLHGQVSLVPCSPISH